MYSKGARKPNSNEKKWHERIRKYASIHGAIPCGTNRHELHHVKGATFKHRKTHIGEYFVLPIDEHLHSSFSAEPLNVTYHPKAFESEFGTQGELFIEMCETIAFEDGELIVPTEVMLAIGDYVGEKIPMTLITRCS